MKLKDKRQACIDHAKECGVEILKFYGGGPRLKVMLDKPKIMSMKRFLNENWIVLDDDIEVYEVTTADGETYYEVTEAEEKPKPKRRRRKKKNEEV